MTGIPAQLWVQQQITQIEAQSRLASSRIAQARDMRSVIQATHISVRPELRAVQNTIPGLRRMKADAEARLNVLLDEQLAAIRKAETAEDALNLKGQYQTRHWEHLRGYYAPLYRRAQAEARAIVRKKEIAEES